MIPRNPYLCTANVGCTFKLLKMKEKIKELCKQGNYEECIAYIVGYLLEEFEVTESGVQAAISGMIDYLKDNECFLPDVPMDSGSERTDYIKAIIFLFLVDPDKTFELSLKGLAYSVRGDFPEGMIEDLIE